MWTNTCGKSASLAQLEWAWNGDDFGMLFFTMTLLFTIRLFCIVRSTLENEIRWLDGCLWTVSSVFSIVWDCFPLWFAWYINCLELAPIGFCWLKVSFLVLANFVGVVCQFFPVQFLWFLASLGCVFYALSAGIALVLHCWWRYSGGLRCDLTLDTHRDIGWSCSRGMIAVCKCTVFNQLDCWCN